MGAGLAEDGGAVGGVDGDRRELGLDRGGDRGEALELLVEEAPSPGSSAVAKWVQTPASSRSGSSAQARARASTASRVAVAEPAHAAVVLDVDPGRAGPGRGRGSPPGARKSSCQTATSEPAASAASSSSSVSAPIVSSGTCGRRRPISAASAPVATASRVAPPASAAVGAGVGAVAVAVGLDHRAELDAVADGRVEVGAVALHRGDVDPGYCPRHG